MHEAITRHARETLIGTKETAERLGFAVLHGITDCIFVQGSPIAALKDAVEAESGYTTEVETFDWVVFLPQKDGTGAYTWYYGRLDDGEVKVRGIMARRGDCPAYVQRFQQEALALMGTARSIAELRAVGREVRALYGRYCDGLASAPLEDLVVARRIQHGELCAAVPGAGRGRGVPTGRRGRGPGDDHPVRRPGRPGRPRRLRLGGRPRRSPPLPPPAREGVGRGGRRDRRGPRGRCGGGSGPVADAGRRGYRAID